MPNLSRRSIVASAAALPALTLPAVANALPAGADVELQQLGVRLLEVRRDVDVLGASAVDGEDYDNAMNAAIYRLGDLMQPIFAFTATTPTGLAVQAAAAVAACADLWDMPSKSEAPLDVERDFIEAVCRYTGVKHPPINVKHLQIMAALDEDGARAPTADKVVEIADKMLVEYDRIGAHGRDIEPSEWKLYDSLDAELWEIPATSINDLATKARVLDQRLRINGEAHSESDRVWCLIDELLAMAVQS